MRLEYLGNPQDCMKGAVLGVLLQEDLLQNLVVEPMAHAVSSWSEEALQEYVQILRLDSQDRIAKHNMRWDSSSDRALYFAELDRYSGRDFFLDPDVGVATSKAKRKHIKPTEVLELVQDQNIVAVYQHGARGQAISQRVQTVVQALQRCQPGIECLAYTERRAAILFLANQPRRLRDIEARLDDAHLEGFLKVFVPNRNFLTRIQLMNYKSIATADVRLPQVSLLIGPNGSGKSNFLDALRFTAEALNTSLDHALRTRGGIDLVQRKPRESSDSFGLRLQFELSTSYGWYALTIRAKEGDGYEICREECHVAERAAKEKRGPRKHFFHVERGRVVGASISKAPPAMEDRLYLVIASAFKEFRPAFEALAGMRFANPAPERMRRIQAPASTSALNRDCSNAAGVLGSLEKRSPTFKRRIDEYLSGIVPDVAKTGRWPKDADETVGFLLRAGDGELRLPASSMSDGTLRAFGVLLALFQGATREDTERRLVGIEEPEAGQHPGAVDVLMDAIKEAALHTQVIVTSHSPELLDNTEDDSIVTVATTRQGTTQFGTLDDASRSTIRRRLFTAGELLRMDQLGMAELGDEQGRAFDLFATER